MHKRYITTIFATVILRHPFSNRELKKDVFVYMCYKGLFGIKHCKFNKKVSSYHDVAASNPTGPGECWYHYSAKNSDVYQKYILPWLKGDNNSLIRYYTDSGLEVPIEVLEN